MGDNKMLQAIISGQSAIKEELIKLISETKNEVKEVNVEVKENGKRIDKLGLQLAELEEDAPTVEDHNLLDRRVEKLERHIASN